MPSGRGSAGSGSHFGGGRGSSRGSGSGYRGFAYRKGFGYSTAVYLDSQGRGRYMSPTSYTVRVLIEIFFGLMIFISIFSWGSYSSSYDKVEKIEKDYSRYQIMIVNAQNRSESGDDSYLVDGTITAIKLNELCNKWYLEYTFDDNNGNDVEGYTYSIYSHREASEFEVGDVIELAVDRVPITQLTDSINIDYKGMDINKNGEYVLYNKIAKEDRNTSIIITSITFALLIVVVVIRKKFIKNSDPNGSKKVIRKKIEVNELYVCPHCKSRVDESLVCSKCGAVLDSEECERI